MFSKNNQPSDALLDADFSFSQPPFSTLIDSRVLVALADQKFAHPTLVQAKAIPLLLEGKDVLARARTGSGKTAAYVVPAVQKILEAKADLSPASAEYQATRAVILVPTKELALQVSSFIKNVTKYCEGLVQCVDVAAGGSSIQRVLLNDKPDIVISTPTKLLSLLQSKSLSLSELSFLAIDEADLLLSYGFKDDLTRIMDPTCGWIPKLGVQGCLMSATLSDDVEGIKGLILRNPAILTLSEPAAASSLLTQHYTHTSERDKFLLIYVLLKLKLIRGKSIIFVNDVERGYRVKLFLEQFGVKCCVVNSELPLASRYHVVEEFNRGVYDVIVATDEGAGADAEEEEDVKQEENESEEEEGEDADEEAKDEEKETKGEAEPAAGPSKRRAASPPSKPNKRARRADPTSSLARGIDFTSASSVINFDLPLTSTSYMHRVGRTARAGQSGLALSFVVPREKWGKDKAVSIKSAEKDEKVFERIKERVKKESGSEIKEWDWGGRKGEIEGFRYRMEDALKAVTGKRVAEARREEVRRELLNSEKLKSHFAANPLDLSYLRHDAPLHPTRQQTHLKHVPNYLMPKIAALPTGGDVTDHAGIGFSRRGRGGHRGRGGRGGKSGRGKKVDPLKFK
ncbi:ATP-dependent RNA helicase DBP9 [Cryptococcus gattii E566]|uniref:RNA helicase n=2 Tax=Cryptococcus gattii TaxID=37769 RepID=E6RFG9_CRYGW|nr:ATP-dependent RNA helicase, putative [Cryptococcus gattii WM276]ADV25569.1 ATP-dependent RNA helicase, putative [Cryptococcus gattii WM276]KIR78832.1 ATP-dependent RNA helicase DBP9 [Cryptococcus gattii EJB2]KIY32828.1 ATP-dependent RNA helicase DBP9 [Cryptococcus gattii E566]KJE05108.1 ATP-dependent RNA helicase DBP9 [Cryptococcus gattii NT-10]